MFVGSHFSCHLRQILAVLLLSLHLPLAQAFTWADPGDMELRHDLQLLNDRGLINIPLTTWPLAWKDIHRVVSAIDEVEAEAADVNEVIFRVTRKMDRALQQKHLHGIITLFTRVLHNQLSNSFILISGFQKFIITVFLPWVLILSALLLMRVLLKRISG